MIDVGARLVAVAGAEHVHANAPLAPLTTFKVGGPADWLVDAHGLEALRALVAVATDAALPLTILGGGSNVLVSDAGVRGIVVRVRGGEVRRIDSSLIRADAGVTINGLVRWSVNRGVSGIEAWAGTPGTVDDRAVADHQVVHRPSSVLAGTTPAGSTPRSPAMSAP